MKPAARRFGLYCDFRNPPSSSRSAEQVHAENFDQLTWADSAGFGCVRISEHYFTDDGYSPAPLALATGIAAKTSSPCPVLRPPAPTACLDGATG